MWEWLLGKKKEPPPSPPSMVLVPPLFDFPPLAARTSMVIPAYDMLFGNIALRSLFEDYFERAGHFTTRILLKPIDDPHVDLVATVSGALKGKKEGDAVFRWQRDLDDPHTFLEISVSNSKQLLQLKSCAYCPRYGLGFFGVHPGLVNKRVRASDYGTLGIRYGSEHLSIGTTFAPYPSPGEFPTSAWAVTRVGRLTLGAQYKPNGERKVANSKYWNCAIGYGLGSMGPLKPSFNFALELANGSELRASFYQHIVVQRRVRNPVEEDQIVGITNYIDLGFELQKRIGSDSKDTDPSFQIAASWQANKNILLKAKLGSCISSAAFVLKSWWKPSITLGISAISDRITGTLSYGFGVGIEDLREARYERADPNYVMLARNKEHLADGVLGNWGERLMFESEIDSGNYDRLPKELRPFGKII